jgi:hypothetical protein
VERSISHECRELLPKIAAASPREISGIVGSYIMDWTPRLRRNGSKVSKALRAAASLVRNGDVLREDSPDYPKVVVKFFTKVLTGLVGTTSEHKKLTAELRKVRKDSRLDSMVMAGPMPFKSTMVDRTYHAAPASAQPLLFNNRPPLRIPPVNTNPNNYTNTQLALKALQRHFERAKLPQGTCWCCEYLGRKSTGIRHSAKTCSYIGEAERVLRDKGSLN